MLVWLGDFNYRINCTYEEAKESIQHGWIKELLAKVEKSMPHPWPSRMLTCQYPLSLLYSAYMTSRSKIQKHVL